MEPQTRATASGHPDAGSPDHFVRGLSGPGALDLVVEMVHDLRSPLTSILALSEALMLGKGGAVTEVQRRHLGVVHGAAVELEAITSNVIEIACDGGSWTGAKLTPFLVGDLLGTVERAVRPIAEHRGIALRVVSPPDDRRLGRPQAVARILLNLAVNALRSTEDGYVEIAATAPRIRTVSFSVRDTGPGVDPASIESLVTPFRRSRARDEYVLCQKGLGLAICRRLLRTLGSDLEVESRPDWGTRFHFELDWPRS